MSSRTDKLDEALSIIWNLTKFYMDNENWAREAEKAREFVRKIKNEETT